MLSTHIHNPEYVDRVAVAVSLDAATVLNIQAIYHNPKRAEGTTHECVAYHILITWYASSSQTQVEKLCKLREIFYALGYSREFDMFLVDFDFDLLMMKKGGVRKQKPAMEVPAIIRQGSFPKTLQLHLGPMGRTMWESSGWK